MVDSSPQFQQSVRVSLLFEGKKLFRLQKKCISFVLIEHKIIGSLDPISPIIEVVAYSHPNEEDISTVFEAPRLYLSSHKIFRKLDDADLHVGGLIVTEDTQFAATLIAKYIYGRIVISTKPFRPGSEQIIEIEIIPLESDVNSSDFSSGTYDIFHDGIRILGQLPPINNIRYELRLPYDFTPPMEPSVHLSEIDIEWDRRLVAFRHEKDLCDSAFRAAFSQSKVAATAVNVFLSLFSEGQHCRKTFSKPRQLWIAAIRKVLLQCRVLLYIRQMDDIMSNKIEKSTNVNRKESGLKGFVTLPSFRRVKISSPKAIRATSPLSVQSKEKSPLSNFLSTRTCPSLGMMLTSKAASSSSPYSPFSSSLSPLRPSPPSTFENPYDNILHSAEHNPSQGRSRGKSPQKSNTSKQQKEKQKEKEKEKEKESAGRKLKGGGDEKGRLSLSEFLGLSRIKSEIPPDHSSAMSDGTRSLQTEHNLTEIGCQQSPPKSTKSSKNCKARSSSPTPSPLRRRRHRTRKTFCLQTTSAEKIAELDAHREYSAEELEEHSLQERESKEIKELIRHLRNGEGDLLNINLRDKGSDTDDENYSGENKNGNDNDNDNNDEDNRDRERDHDIDIESRKKIEPEMKAKNHHIPSLYLNRIKAFDVITADIDKAANEMRERNVLENEIHLVSPRSPERNKKINLRIFTQSGARKSDHNDKCSSISPIERSPDKVWYGKYFEEEQEKCRLASLILPLTTDTTREKIRVEKEKEKLNLLMNRSPSDLNFLEISPRLGPRSPLSLCPIRSPNTSPGPSPALTSRSIPGSSPVLDPISLPLLFPATTSPYRNQINRSRSTTPVNRQKDYLI